MKRARHGDVWGTGHTPRHPGQHRPRMGPLARSFGIAADQLLVHNTTNMHTCRSSMEHQFAAEERALAELRGQVSAAWRLASDPAARRVAEEINTARLPEAAPPVLNGTPLLSGPVFGSGRREFAAEVSWDLPSLAPGATALLGVTVNGARAGDLASASLVSSTRFIELNAAVRSNNTVRVMARNISAATFDFAAATLSVGVAKRRAP